MRKDYLTSQIEIDDYIYYAYWRYVVSRLSGSQLKSARETGFLRKLNVIFESAVMIVDVKQVPGIFKKLSVPAMIMALYRDSDSENATLIAMTFPDIVEEFMARYRGPGGFILPAEQKEYEKVYK